MADPGFRVEGLTAFLRSLDGLALDVDDLKGAFGALAAEGAGLAAGFAPKRSGDLAGDIRGNRAKSKAVVTAGRATIPYAGAVNYGWGSSAGSFKHGRYASGIRGNYAGSGFMQKASDAMEPIAIARLESEINAAIRRRGLT